MWHSEEYGKRRKTCIFDVEGARHAPCLALGVQSISRRKTSSGATTIHAYDGHSPGYAEAPPQEHLLDGPRLEPAALGRLLLTAALGIYLLVVLRNAWVAEDAYVTFRSLDNFTHGLGLRWNAADRVQAFSHPLWLFALTPLHLALQDPYAAAIVLSIALSFSAVFIGCRYIASSRGAGILVAVALTSSRAFIDYSTSGLENPLTHFLLALFFAVFVAEISREKGPSIRRLSWMSGLLGLLAVNRLDTIVLCAPSFVLAWTRCREPGRNRAALIGLVPLLAWEATSLIYFGSFVPNTAYAKLNTGIDKLEVWAQGGVYFVDLLAQDPLSSFLLFLGVATPLALRQRQLYAAVLGLVGYLVYIVYIGGDFMSGRFFSAPFFVACVTLSQVPLTKAAHAATAIGVVIGLSFFGPNSPFTSGPEVQQRSFGASGVADERSYYYVSTGLLRWARLSPFPDNLFLSEGRRDRKLAESRHNKLVTRRVNVGFYGYASGRGVHVVDPFALGDALLARLPAAYEPRWRVGHYDRVVPRGYEQGFKTGRAQLADPKLNEYYKKIRLVTQGPVWSWARWDAIWGLMSGRYESLIDRQRYRFADPTFDRDPLSWKQLILATDPEPQDELQPILRFSGTSALVQSSQTRHDKAFRWHYTSPKPSRLYFLLGTQIVGKVSLPESRPHQRRSETISVPEEARRSGFDGLYFRGERGPFSHDLYGIELR